MAGRPFGAKTIQYRSTLVRGYDRIYSACVRVPAELETMVGARFLRFSLHTKELDEATFLLPFAARDISEGLEEILARRRINEIFDNHRGDFIQITGDPGYVAEPPREKVLAALAEACTPKTAVRHEAMYELDDGETRTLLRTVDTIVTDFAVPVKRYSRGYWRLVSRIDRLRRREAAERIRGTPVGGDSAAEPSRNGRRDATVLEAVILFDADYGPNWSPGTRRKYETAYNLLMEYVGPDTSMRSVTRDHLRGLRGILEDLVPNWTQRPQVRHLSLEDAAKKSRELKLRRRTPSAIKDVIDKITVFVGFAAAEGLVDRNFAENMHRGLARHTASPPPPFDILELQAIFRSAPLYDPPPPLEKRDGMFWLPLLGLWTGMRLSECAQLRTRDICIVGDVPIIRITPDDTGEEPDGDKRVKTRHSVRVMPIHPILQQVGFVSFWRRAQVAGADRLFPEFKRHGAAHGFELTAKRLTRFVRSVTDRERKLCFQSFRHTFRDAARDGSLPDERARILGGWGNKNISDSYGVGGTIPRLYRDIQAIAYPGLDLSHLEP